MDCLRSRSEDRRLNPVSIPIAIPWASPQAQYRAHREAIQGAIEHVLDSASYILGAEVETFERAFAEYCGAAHGIGVGNGTDALILALKALGIGPGDEVITVSHTAVATVAAVLACGATPVLIDVDRATYTINPSLIEAAVTPLTKAIVPVHLYGQPAEMDAIIAIGRSHGLRIVEDCAQAVGARYRGRRVGSIGDIACFSFYPTKNLGAIGDGGMVITKNAELASRVRRLRQYGWDDARKTHEIGVNSRLDPIQAAILGVKLAHLDADNRRRVAIAGRYNQALADLPLTLPFVHRDDAHVYHLYVVGCEERARLMAHLAADGIGSAIHYPAPVHRHGGYAELVVLPKAGLPVTGEIVDRILSLPIYPELSDADADRVVASIRRYCEASERQNNVA
jgi:dTDP-4-amino-4,6-dideoxygalactose transaminase